MQTLKHIGRGSIVALQGIEKAGGGASGYSYLIDDVIEREAFQFRLLVRRRAMLRDAQTVENRMMRPAA